MRTLICWLLMAGVAGGGGEFRMIEQMLIDHEGSKINRTTGRHIAYKCSRYKTTVGYGRNLEDRGLSEEEALYLLRNDIKWAESELRFRFEEYETFPRNIQAVLIDMVFCLGPGGFDKFEKFKEAVREADRGKMVKELENSLWYYQAMNRVQDLIRLIMRF